MKYKITRTSSRGDDAQPCEGCVRESYIETQEIKQRDDIKKPGGTWFTHGFNHREEDGKWKRDHSYEGWFLEVPDVVAFAKAHSQIVLTIPETGFPEIEIYDDHRE